MKVGDEFEGAVEVVDDASVSGDAGGGESVSSPVKVVEPPPATPVLSGVDVAALIDTAPTPKPKIAGHDEPPDDVEDDDDDDDDSHQTDEDAEAVASRRRFNFIRRNR
jgi:hypothetical protein